MVYISEGYFLWYIAYGLSNVPSDVILNVSLKHTELIHTHGLELPSEVDPNTLGDQVYDIV